MSGRDLILAFEKEFQKSRSYCERAIGQLDDASLHVQINPQQNNIATIMQHVSGNLLSRFTDFLTSDGEKPTRNRDAEFIDQNLSRAELMALWNKAWTCVFDALASLTDSDLSRVITIRKEPHTVQLALIRSCAHAAWHAAQIALIAKHVKGSDWQYLTVPPGGSAEFNRKMGM